MIPDLDSATKHLPPGRYLCSMREVRERFVLAYDMSGSATRPTVWRGLLAYVAAWDAVQADLAQHLGDSALVKCLWLAGSFISGKLDPGNADLTVVLDGDAVDLCKGRRGAGALRDLSDRDDMLARFLVSTSVVRYRYLASPFRLQSLGSGPQMDYLAARGAWDDWWQRARPVGVPKGPPTRETAEWTRGYLEVRL